MSYARVQPMLPITSLEEIVGFDPRDDHEESRWAKPTTRIQTTSSVHRIPSARAIAQASVRALPALIPLEAPPVPQWERTKPTVVTSRSRASRRMVWPVFLCGFIAGIFGGLAFVKSPAGQRPAVQHVVKKANAVLHGR